MLSQAQRTTILELNAQQVSKREIARVMGISRVAVRKVLLWGVGQRVFFLHDGRTSNLVEAIEAHRSQRSEANKVIDRFDRLRVRERQDIINFLRSL